VEVDSAVELCGRCVVFHNGSFVVGSQDPGLNTFGYAGRCSSTSPLVNPMLTKTTKGFEGSIKSPEPTAVGACSSAIAVHVAGRRWLSFLR
jgi:hypothetical protein